jgi:hypothetical protein
MIREENFFILLHQNMDVAYIPKQLDEDHDHIASFYQGYQEHQEWQDVYFLHLKSKSASRICDYLKFFKGLAQELYYIFEDKYRAITFPKLW